MPNIKPLYLICAAGILFFVLTVLSFQIWFSENQENISQAVEQGKQQALIFAKGKNQNDCLEQAIKKISECRDATCSAEHDQFLTQCFINSQYSQDLCQQAPMAEDYFGTVSWSVSQCRKRKVKNGNCPNLLNKVPKLCQLTHPKTV
ncbi:hypothetical protein C2869_11500 [Saccharobesus litoralis]|uniref:Uncharacterized protein n=1 Tax=Saccharobesus litoralis TaxID=2172099 RepID=A0A2S0VS29_9ALTE|nr:hypothetical protein [Saccharobesus litoralis]AWB67025.1 hypothetical protein C2869_11500 [Saccharobesus litoralis]